MTWNTVPYESSAYIQISTDDTRDVVAIRSTMRPTAWLEVGRAEFDMFVAAIRDGWNPTDQQEQQ